MTEKKPQKRKTARDQEVETFNNFVFSQICRDIKEVIEFENLNKCINKEKPKIKFQKHGKLGDQ